ncbi:MAG: aldo/keto reductase [Anaerolineae bacterium]|nr:aldo/keto reductase [Anaerolineae bacterium]
MEYRPLGRTGVMVSSLCLGAMNFGGVTTAEDGIAMIDRALDAGINFIDTANVYNAGESEKVVGKALQANGKRDSIVLATKVNGAMGSGLNDRGISRYHIIKACEDSLRRLQTDHIDLYQLHRPSLTIPQDETLRALDDLVRAGKVRYIGSSTFPAWMLMEGLATSQQLNLVRFISEQPPYNLLDRRIENELVPLCQKYDIAILPWSPLAGGILAGRYSANGTGTASAVKENLPEGSRAKRSGAQFQDRLTERGLDVAEQVGALASERGLKSSQFALLWCKDQPGITAPIIGPRTMGHLEDALAIADKKLEDADRAALDSLVHPGTAVADFHNSNEWMKARVY